MKDIMALNNKGIQIVNYERFYGHETFHGPK